MTVNFIKPLEGNIYNRVVQILVCAAVVLLPLFYLPFTSSTVEYNKQLLLVALASAGLVVWLLGVVVSGRLTVRTSPVDKGVCAVLLATLVATLFSVARARSVFGLSSSLSSSLLTVTALSVFYFLIVNTFHDRGRMLRSALSLSVTLALCAGLAQMFTWYFLPGGFTHSRAFDLVGSLNTLGVLAAVCLALFAKTTTRGSHLFDFWVAIIGVVAAILVLGILNWWVLWTIALVSMLAIIAFDSLNITQLSEDYGTGRRGRFALARFVIPMTVVVIGAFLLLVDFKPGGLRTNFPVEISPSYRLSWQVTYDALRQKPVFGYGPENFSIAFDRFGASQLADSQLATMKFPDAIGEVFTIAVQNGILGLLAFGLLLWCLVQVIARFSGAISESVARGESAAFASQASGTLAAMVALGVAMFMYPFNTTLYFLWFVLLALAALIVTGDRSKTVDIEERPMYSLASSLGFIVGLIVVLTGLYFFTVMYLADVAYARALAEKTPAVVLDGLARAINLDSTNDRYLRDASQVTLVMLRNEVSQQTKNQDPQRATRIQNLLSSAVQLAQRATSVAPMESLNWSNLGQVYQALSGLVDNVENLAQDAFTKASDLRPGDPTFDNQVGSMWLGRSDLIRQVARNSTGSNAVRLQQQADDSLKKAEAAFKNALEKSPNFGLAIYNLGTVYDRQGKVTDAINQLERIAPYNPNEPMLMFELGLLYSRAGRKDNALGAMQRTVLLSPQYADARWYLALLLEERGDLTGALDQLYEIQKNNSGNQVLQQKISQLQAGQRSIPPAKVIDSKPLQ